MAESIKSIISDGAYNLTEDFISDDNPLAGFIGFEGMVYLLQFARVYIEGIEEESVKQKMYDQYADFVWLIAEKVAPKLDISIEEYAPIFDSRCRMYEGYHKAISAKGGKALAEYGRIYHMIFSLPIGGIPEEKIPEFESQCLLNTSYFALLDFIARETCVKKEVCERLEKLKLSLSTQSIAGDLMQSAKQNSVEHIDREWFQPVKQKEVQNKSQFGKEIIEEHISWAREPEKEHKKELDTPNDGCVKVFALSAIVAIVLLWIITFICS
jgi:hypothetical protein